MDKNWQEWAVHNLDRGCDPEQILESLLKQRFALASIQKVMGDKFPTYSPQLQGLIEQPAPSRADAGVDFNMLNNVNITRIAQRFPSDKVQLYVLDNFMSETECDDLTAIINQHLRPSTITIYSDDTQFRTSQTSDLSQVNHPLVAQIDDKIARTLGIRLTYSEGNQAQRYDVGQQFKAHTDYFEPNTPEYAKYGGARGQRTWTFMVYLNETPRGGGTNFINLEHIFYPKKGRALVWNNLNEDGTPNYDTLHAGMPVEEGHKVIITKWFRTRGTGPMLYS